MKIPESKRSDIRIIAEFRGIQNGFPNLDIIILQKMIAPSWYPKIIIPVLLTPNLWAL